MAEHPDASPLDVLADAYETIRLLVLLTLLIVFVTCVSIVVIVMF